MVKTKEQIKAEIELLNEELEKVEYKALVDRSNQFNDSDLIVGCTRDSQIHIGDPAFRLIINGTYDRLISKADAKFIAQCMPNSPWEKVAETMPLFGFILGNYYFLEDGFCQPGMYKLEEEDKHIAEVSGHEDYKHCSATFD